MLIPLYSYSNCFATDPPDKLRPGFALENKIYVLTRTLPRNSQYLELPPHAIKGHWYKENCSVYVTIPDSNPKKYNNAEGGYIDSELIKGLGDPTLSDYTIFSNI